MKTIIGIVMAMRSGGLEALQIMAVADGEVGEQGNGCFSEWRCTGSSQFIASSNCASR